MMNQSQEEQISTKEFLKKTFAFFKVIGNNWRLLMIGLLTGATISIIQDIINKKETTYDARIVFNLDIGGGGGGNAMGQFGGLATAFGVAGVGGMQQNQGGDLLSGSNFPALVQSRIVYEKALMMNVEVYGKKLLMANYYKDSSDIKKTKWAGNLIKKPYKKGIEYRFVQKDPDLLTPEENEIISSIYEDLLEKTTLIGIEGSSFTQISAITSNEMLSKVWAETLLKATEVFYKEIKTKKTRELLRQQASRLDSLRGLMLSTDGQLARLTFQNTNVIDAVAPMRQQQVGRNNQFYSTQYFNQLATVEGLNRLLIEQTPIFTVVEPIRLPLIKYMGGIGQSFKMGSVLGIVLTLVFVILRNTYKEIIKPDLLGYSDTTNNSIK